jgi:hypothetical protein
VRRHLTVQIGGVGDLRTPKSDRSRAQVESEIDFSTVPTFCALAGIEP